MKKITVFILAIFFTLICFSQNSESQMDDKKRIAIAVNMKETNLPDKQKTVLESKLLQIVSINGLANSKDTALFYITAEINIKSSNITSTQPAYHVYILEITLYIKDSLKDNIYSSITRINKAVGKNETEAFTKAFNQIEPKKSYYRAFITKAKKNILSFYNTDIEFVLTTAQAYIDKGENEKAKKLLLSVPNVCRESYDKAIELYKTIEN